MKTVRSVLEDLAKSAQCANYTNDEGDFCIECFSERITQALADLKEVLVPTEKQGIKCHTGRIGSELSEYSPTDNQKVGWNLCRTEILKRFDNQPNSGGK